MAEKAVNDFATTLTAGVNASTTTIPVAAAAPVGLQSGEFRVRIDDELLLVTSGQNGTSWTATRGAEGTAAASHAVNAAVTHVLTDASLDLLVQQLLDVHLTDGTAAHAASAISVTPFSTIAATDVQSALVEIVAEAVGGGNASAKFEAVTLGATPSLDVASKTIAVFEAAAAMTTNVVATTSNRPDGSVIFLAGRQATSGGPFTFSLDGTTIGIPTTAGQRWLAMVVAGDVDEYGGLFGITLPIAQADVTNLVTDLAAKMVNPMTTAGDVILGGASGAPTRLAKGSNNTFLGVDGSGNVVYGTPPGFANPMTTADDIIFGGASGVPTRKAKPTASKYLGTDSGGAFGYFALPAGGSASRVTSGWEPTDSGWLTATFDVQSATTGTALGAGTIHLVKMAVPVDIIVAKLAYVITANGTGLTASQSWAGLYSSGGTLIAKTADQSTNWVSGPGFYTETALTAEAGQSLSLVGGPLVYVYAAFVSNGTTRPAFLRSANTTAGIINGSLGSLAHRAATGGSGTSLPATIASTTASGTFPFAALVA